MATDFFTSQDNARKQTGRLVALFVFGVLATMISFWLVAVVPIAFARGANTGDGRTRNGSPDWGSAFSDWRVLLAVVVIVGTIVTIATLVKLAQLSQGGAKIAEMLGGVRINPGTNDAEEREVLNIVEEMSIASGVPVPPVYLMESASINAFAAGPDPTRSVIGVTRGCIHLLNRDELQGVIAHEYSHIFHGDTRINARTTAVIAGIMAIGVLGYIMFRFVGPALARTRGGKNNPGPAIGAAIIVAGLLIWAIGSLGMLFGRMIQAAISRQREFLADASAVQYTRNPDGIGSALAKIRDHYSARIDSPAASELNHFFFCSSLNTLFATHPPIGERIQRIVGMGAITVGAREATRAAQPSDSRAAQPRHSAPPRHSARAHGATAAIAGLAGLAGTLDAEPISHAREWREGLSRDLQDAAHNAIGARALCYANARRTANHSEVDRVVAEGDREAYAAYAAIAVPLAQLSADKQLALIDLAAPSLFDLGPSRYRAFREVLTRAIRADAKIDLQEWSLVKCLERHVERRFVQTPAKTNARWTERSEEVRTLLAVIASTEHSGDDIQHSFSRAYNALGVNAPALPAVSMRSLDALNSATARLCELSFSDRARLLNAAAAAAHHDSEVTVEEHLVLRAVADALDVPLPALAAVAR